LLPPKKEGSKKGKREMPFIIKPPKPKKEGGRRKRGKAQTNSLLLSQNGEESIKGGVGFFSMSELLQGEIFGGERRGKRGGKSFPGVCFIALEDSKTEKKGSLPSLNIGEKALLPSLGGTKGKTKNLTGKERKKLEFRGTKKKKKKKIG